MVTRDEVDAVARPQVGERFHVRGELLHRSVHEIAGDGDHVDVQGVDCFDDAAQEVAFDRGADMHVADLRDREPFERRWQTAQRHLDVDDARSPARIDESDDCGQHREEGHRNGGCGLERGGLSPGG